MPGTGWALCCHCCPRHYCFIPLNCWEPVPEGFGSSTRPPPRLAGGEVLDSASPTAAPPFCFWHRASPWHSACREGSTARATLGKHCSGKSPEDRRPVFFQLRLSPQHLGHSSQAHAKVGRALLHQDVKARNLWPRSNFFFFPQSIVFFKHPSFETQLEESKITHLQGIPPHCYKLTYALPFKLNLKQFFWKHKNYLFYI